MGAQVTNWIYSDQDDVRYFNSNVNYQVAEDTVTEAYKYFSSTSFFKDHTHILDNKFEEEGLIVRPITSQQGKTGIMCFTLTHPDAKWRSDANGCYGEYSLFDLIDNVFVAAGLAFTEEDIRQSYRGRVAERVKRQGSIASTNRANTVITNSSGGYKTLAWCDKMVIDAILQAMCDEGMFECEYDIPDPIPAGVLDTSPVITKEEAVEILCSDLNNSPAFIAFKNQYQSYQGWTFDKYWVMEQLEAVFSANDIDVDTYDYCEVHQTFSMPIAGYANSITISMSLNNFINDQLSLSDPVQKREYFPDAGGEGWYYSIPTNDYMAAVPRIGGGTTGNYDRPLAVLQIQYDQANHEPVVSNSYFYRTTLENTGIYNGARSEIVLDPPRVTVYYTDIDCSNWGFSALYPEGIIKQEDAWAPVNPSSVSVDSYGAWTGRKTMQGHLLGTMTYVPIGYGDIDNPSWLQARAQSGEIWSDQYQERLGVFIESIEDYPTIKEVITGEPDDPITPDPEPTPTPTPDPTPASLANSNLFQVHQLSDTEMNNLGDFLFSNDFLDAMKNMFMEPLDAVIGCFVLNHGGTMPLGASETLKLGSVLGTTGVTGTKLTNQFQLVPCGAVNINEYYENVEDYAPYSKAQIFLPYCGYQTIDVNEIMGGRVEVDYILDCFTGACLIRVYVTKSGVKQELYNFSGNTAVQLPLTSRDFTRGVTSILSGAFGVVGGAMSGDALAMAYGASQVLGNLSDIKRSGSLSANLGAMGSQKPFILIERPVAYNAQRYPSFYGKPSNWTVTLGSCSGYTRVKDVHLDSIVCTDAEKEEILQLLQEGVIF